MTYEEAMDILNNAAWLGTDNGIKVYKAVGKAIEALEKQVPKKKHKYMGFRCVCGKEVAKNQAYCEYCGQRLE